MPITEMKSEVIRIFEKVGALREGHFVLTSGRHADRYINKDAIYPHTDQVWLLCSFLCSQFWSSRVQEEKVQVVVGPEKGGIILSHRVADHFRTLGDEVVSVFAEKTGDGGFTFSRGYEKYVTGKNVLIVEDILTTGGSVKEVVELVRSHGGNVVGVAAICNRGGVSEKDIGNVPRLASLETVELPSWGEKECPLCKEGVPVNTDVGKGKAFLERKISEGN